MTPEDNIRKADDTFFEIFHDLRILHYLNPVNHQEEREKFMNLWEDRNRYNPTFEYNLLPTTIGKSKKRLEALDFGITSLEEAFGKVRQELLLTLSLLETRCTPEFTPKATALYKTPTPELLTDAKSILQKPMEEALEPDLEIGIKGLEEKLRGKLREERIEGWDVVEDPFNVHLAHVDWPHHKIRLQSGMIVTEQMVERLTVHEIGVHVYRSINGERQPYRTFAVGFNQYLETEEGLAVAIEDKMGLLSSTVHRRYAGRVLASHKALTDSFFDIFLSLVEFFSPDDAYSLTQRSKRGTCDTQQPGGLIQDHIYLSGKKKVEVLSNEDLLLLYTGRIAVDHLPLVREMLAEKRIVEPAFTPEVLHG